MILVDTSVWVDHLRQGDSRLGVLLEGGEVLVHPFVVGELACGNLKHRRRVLDLLDQLPVLSSVSDAEALHLVESRRLMGKGLGWVDIHLLASCVVAGARLWTRDRTLATTATSLGVG